MTTAGGRTRAPAGNEDVGSGSDPRLPPPGRWEVDPAASVVEFVARHLLVSRVRGRFHAVRGVIEVAADVLDSVVEATAETASLDTGDAARDEHLRSRDFFDVDRWPAMTLTGRGLSPDGDRFRLGADLTIRDVCAPVTFTVTVAPTDGHDGYTTPEGGAQARFLATATLNRKDFGLQWNAAIETGGVVVGDIVDILIDVTATRR